MSGGCSWRCSTLKAGSKSLQVIDHLSFVCSKGLPQRLWDRLGRRQEGLGKAAGFFSVEPNNRLLGNQSVGGLQSVSNDERGDRAAFDGCRALEHFLVPLAHARHEPLTLSFRRGYAHGRKVCLRGTHCKDKSDRVETEAPQSGVALRLPPHSRIPDGEEACPRSSSHWQPRSGDEAVPTPRAAVQLNIAKTKGSGYTMTRRRGRMRPRRGVEDL